MLQKLQRWQKLRKKEIKKKGKKGKKEKTIMGQSNSSDGSGVLQGSGCYIRMVIEIPLRCCSALTLKVLYVSI